MLRLDEALGDALAELRHLLAPEAPGARSRAGDRGGRDAGRMRTAGELGVTGVESTSTLRMRPAGPLPCTVARSTPWSAAILRARGVAFMGRRLPRRSALVEVATSLVAAATVTDSFAGGAASLGGRSPAGSMRPITSPTSISAPSVAITSSSARLRRRNLERDLVRLDLDEGLVLLDPLAGLLVPGAEDDFGDRFTGARDDDDRLAMVGRNLQRERDSGATGGGGEDARLVFRHRFGKTDRLDHDLLLLLLVHLHRGDGR